MPLRNTKMMPARHCTLLARHFPEHRRGIANAAIGIGIGIGPAIGMFMGGMLMARIGWRSVFVAPRAFSRFHSFATLCRSAVSIAHSCPNAGDRQVQLIQGCVDMLHHADPVPARVCSENNAWSWSHRPSACSTILSTGGCFELI
jgi:hypothetical protein